MVRTNFHVHRVSLAVLRMGMYSSVCGIFFFLGMEIGRHEMNKFSLEGTNNDSLMNPSTDSNVKAPVKLQHVEPIPAPEGILPVPNAMKPGEMGKPFKPSALSEYDKKLMKDGWQKNAFNQYVSDLISVERSLPDIRHPKCSEPDRLIKNPSSTSIIICFHNEAWSVLLRSVHSVINRSPLHLIKEIILVDDCSTMDHLKNQLEIYMKRFPKVRIIRAPVRLGLIRARMMGANIARGKILTFLDSHIEATEGWLPPLLDRIGRDDTTVVCPTIDVIDDNTFEYKYNSPDAMLHSVGIFDWTLTFKWQMISKRERSRLNNTAQPFHSPTMAGGLFSISKRFFDRLGQYDPEFDIWGGENLELSFKTWMCGGTLEIIPCSHVGHIFRNRSPYEWRTGVNVIRKNLVRLAKVWTDEYSKYYYEKIGNNLGDFGDISSRLELRKRLKCKSFRWYLRNVYPEMFIPDGGYAYGEIRNVGLGGNLCLDSKMDKRESALMNLFPCHGQKGNQIFSYTSNFEIRRDEACMDFAGDRVKNFPCHGAKGNQEWHYNSNTLQMRHQIYQKCLAVTNTSILFMEECSPLSVTQRWKLENYRDTIPEENSGGD